MSCLKKKKKICGAFTQWNTTWPLKNEILPCVTAWQDLKDILLSEINQSEKDKYHMIYMWNLKSNVNKQNRNRHTDTEIRRVVARGEGR